MKISLSELVENNQIPLKTHLKQTDAHRNIDTRVISTSFTFIIVQFKGFASQHIRKIVFGKSRISV